MICDECGSDVAENDIYCPFCGISLAPLSMVASKEDAFESTIVIAGTDMPKPAVGSDNKTSLDDKSSSADAGDDPVHIDEPSEETVLPTGLPPESFADAEPSDQIESEENIEDEISPLEAKAEDENPEAAVEEEAEPAEPDISATEMSDAIPIPGEDSGVGRTEIEPSGEETVNAKPEIESSPESGGYELSQAEDESVPADGQPVSDLPESIGGDNLERGVTTGPDGKKPGLKPLTEGTVLNHRYEILKKIGGGGMGAVYLANDRNLGGVQRAVKEMVQAHIEEEQQEKAIEDFRRESMILSSLDHPSIPTIYDYFFDSAEGRFYLVMKYISGGDLAGRLRASAEGRIDELTVTEWGAQVADVLAYLHSLPQTIVYRDLKPSNIMLDGTTGKVMLIDFGIARSINHVEQKGVTAVGTMGYAPPELFSGNVEPRSDVYSLGSTMFHLMTGADPQNNPLLIFDFEKNPRPRQINPRLSDQVERILMKCVEYNAESRFSSAAELRDHLSSHAENLRAGRVSFGVTDVPVAVGLADQTVFCGFCGQRIVAADMFCAFCGAKQPIAQQGFSQPNIMRGRPNVVTARLIVDGTADLEAPVYLIEKPENLLGRRDPMSNIFPEVDLSKFDPQTKISRRHARIFRDGSTFLIEDLGSSNGTTVVNSSTDSLKLLPHRPHPLVNGDRVRMGDTTLQFVIS